MTTLEVTVGWTRSDETSGYCSFMGYKPGASQHTEVLEIEVAEDFGPIEGNMYALAEAAFVATNSEGPLSPLAQSIRTALDATGYRGQGAHYSLSVGDTVTVGEVMLACASLGWERVTGVPA